MNYFSTIPGVRGVPLSYVVRENEAPDHETDFGNDFTASSIACAPFERLFIQSRCQESTSIIDELPSGRVGRAVDKRPHTSCQRKT